MTAENSNELLAKALDDYQATLAANGDRAAFALLYKRWHPKLLRLAWRLTGNADEAEDVMQDAAITIAKNIHKLNDPRRFSAWAYTIVRRRSADHIQRNVRNRHLKERAKAELMPLKEKDIEQSLSLKAALASLPEVSRIILILFYVDGMNGRDISTSLDIPLGTVKSRLFAARQKLKKTYISQKGD